MFDSALQGISEVFQKVCDTDAAAAADRQGIADDVRKLQRTVLHADIMLSAIARHICVTQTEIDAAIRERCTVKEPKVVDYSAVRRMNERAANGDSPFTVV